MSASGAYGGVEAEAIYDAGSGTVQFPGIGAVHPAIVMLRPVGEGLDYAISSEVSPGKWMQGPVAVSPARLTAGRQPLATAASSVLAPVCVVRR